MSRLIALTAVFLVVSIAFPVAADEKKPAEDGFTTIFDGKSLDGWKKSGENQDSIQLKDGAIVANGNRCHLFFVGADRPFKNFHFIAEVQTKAHSNGGI